MLLCFGWAIVQVSRKAYTAPMSPAEIDELDYRTAAEDQKLHADCRSWLEAYGLTIPERQTAPVL